MKFIYIYIYYEIFGHGGRLFKEGLLFYEILYADIYIYVLCVLIKNTKKNTDLKQSFMDTLNLSMSV